jgi:formate hydrogenlyase subunit 3/multisubunit Na+/H+ antiporter MnhD subunit
VPKPQAASVLRFVQIGIVLALIGMGMLAHAQGMANLTDINFVNQRNDLHYWGMVAVMTGFGLLAAAALTRFLGRRWGLFDRETK